MSVANHIFGEASHFFTALGAVAAALVVILLLASVHHPRHRFWPTPGPGTWQSFTFWSLFRTLNAAAIVGAVLAAPTLAGPVGVLGLPVSLRVAALVALAIILAVYLWALSALGKSNTYCGRDGLMTRGMYRWSRNPQYAAIMPLYAAMAVAADAIATYALTGALITVYWLMARAEEPWLAAGYGVAYQNYCRTVPRFFNWRRARTLVLGMWRHILAPRVVTLEHRG